MSNLFRPTNEPCKCARCRFARQMPKRASMTEPWCPADTSLSYMGSQNYQRSSITKGRCCRRQRSDFSESYQDFPKKYEHQNFVQEYPEQLPEKYQDYESYVRHKPSRIYGQTCPCCGQLTPRGSQPQQQKQQQQQQNQQQQQHPQQQQHHHQQQQQPPQQQPQQQHQQQQQQHHQQQQPPSPTAPPPPELLSPSLSCCIEKYPQYCCQEDCAGECSSRQRRSRRGRRRKMYCTYECVVTHEVGVQTEDEPLPVTESHSAEVVEVIDVTTEEKEVKHRSGEVETIINKVQSIMVVPNDGNKITKEYVQSQTTSLTNEDDKRTQTHYKENEVDPDSVVIPSKAMDPSELEPMLTNLKASDVARFSNPTEKDYRVYRTNETYEQDYGQKIGKTITETIFDDPKEQRGSSNPPVAQSPVRQSSKTRSPSGKDINKPSHTKKPNMNFGPNQTAFKNKEKKTIKSISDERMVGNRKVHKPMAEDFDNVSTVHMKVTNRKETVSKKRGRDSIHKTAVYESRISELLVMDPKEEKEKPKLKPKPNPKPKPKPKPTEINSGFPTEDVVCRMHGPPRQQVVAPRTRGAGHLRACCPCIAPRRSIPYPTCSVLPMQCDPIYGFGSMPAAYYCH